MEHYFNEHPAKKERFKYLAQKRVHELKAQEDHKKQLAALATEKEEINKKENDLNQKVMTIEAEINRLNRKIFGRSKAQAEVQVLQDSLLKNKGQIEELSNRLNGILKKEQEPAPMCQSGYEFIENLFAEMQYFM